MPTDAELLTRYSRHHDERAFAELVQRHLGPVYAAALRRTAGRKHLAEEVAQKVFADLARKAATLCTHPVLTAWLHRSTRYAAIDAVRAELRRQELQETLAAMRDPVPEEDEVVEWEHLRPVLDEAMDQLKESDRVSMLLRYFEGLSFAEIGQRLNLSENAARMRVERALGKLRVQLGRRGVTSTPAALALLLANRAVAAAPEGLAGSVATTALAKASQTAGAGLLQVWAGSKLAAWAAITVLTLGAGAVGWRWARPGGGRTTAPVDLARVAGEFSANALAVYRLMAQVHPEGADRGAESATVPAGEVRAGVSAPARQAMLDFAEASRARAVPRLSQLITFNAEGAEVARAIHARMPVELQRELPTPEDLFAFFYATDTLLSPVPPAGFLRTFIETEIKPGRRAVHRPGTAPRGLEFVLTAEGWKLEVPTPYLSVLSARILSSETLAKLNTQPQVRAGVAAAVASIEPGSARAALAAFAGACNRGNVTAVVALLRFDPDAKAKTLAFLTTLPPELSGKWRAPEELAADLLIQGAIANPYPQEAVLAQAVESPAGDQRVELVLPDTTRERMQFQHGDSGWKRVITPEMVDGYAQRLARAHPAGRD